jgi:hypothetical protein
MEIHRISGVIGAWQPHLGFVQIAVLTLHETKRVRRHGRLRETRVPRFYQTGLKPSLRAVVFVTAIPYD